MKAASPSRPRPRRTRPRGSLEDVRRLLLEPDRERLVQLEARTPVEDKTVGEVLPEALAHATEERLEALSVALEPTVTRTLKTVIEREPETIGAILAPSIGAAVKRAIADFLLAMQQRFDEALQQSLSIESMRWRLEAKRTGRPFAEVVMLHSLIYRVEQVFLIHSESGLLLQHVADPLSGPVAPDQVASLLSAVGAFARDTFRPLPPGTYLRKVQVGDATIWVEHDAFVTIAAIVHGVAPLTLAEALRETRERLRIECAGELSSFRHDVSAFEPARPVLEGLLREEKRQPRRRARLLLAVIGLILVTAIGGAFSWHEAQDASAEARRRTYARVFEAEPGIAVTSVDRTDDGYLITGFRDPLARTPDEIFRQRRLEPAEVRFASFDSLDPRLAERRIERILRPPPTVRLSLSSDGTLRATGTAPRAWIERARFLATSSFGVERYEDAVLEEEAEALRAASAELEGLEIRFPRDSARVDPQAVREAVSRAQRVIGLAQSEGAAACIQVAGHTDEVGAVRRNTVLSRARATRVAKALVDQGIPDDRLIARGAGTRTGVPHESARVVTFAVELRGAGTECEAA